MADFIHVDDDHYLCLAAIVYAVPDEHGRGVTLVLSAGERITVPMERLRATLTTAQVADRLAQRYAAGGRGAVVPFETPDS
jgi:hypothetical protein